MRAARIANWLGLAAAPSFAMLAALSATADTDMVCSASRGGAPWSGMAAMYLVMAAFHLPAWLRQCATSGPDLEAR